MEPADYIIYAFLAFIIHPIWMVSKIISYKRFKNKIFSISMDVIRQYNNNVFGTDKKLNEKKLYHKVCDWVATRNMEYYYPKGIVYTVTELLEDIIDTDIIQSELDLAVFRLIKL